MNRIPSISLVVLALLATSCGRTSCDDSWLWRLDTKAAALRQCATGGHQGSQLRYGTLLALAGDQAEGQIWLAKAIAGREAKGSLEIADAFNGYKGNPKLAEQWYRRASALGEWEASVRLGLLREKAGDRGDANFWFEHAVRQGGPYAARQIAFLLSHRPRTAGLSTEWYRRGAELGDHVSMGDYARRLGKGEGAAQDVGAAFIWLRKAAAHPKADAYALLDLARAHDEGRGTPRDPRAALAAIRLAKARYLDSSDTRTPRLMEEMERRLVAELSRP